MGATYVGVRRAHPYSWLLSSPQQPLETEDSPTVSLAPQYTSQRLCRASGCQDDAAHNKFLRKCVITLPLPRAHPKFECSFFQVRNVVIALAHEASAPIDFWITP